MQKHNIYCSDCCVCGPHSPKIWRQRDLAVCVCTEHFNNKIPLESIIYIMDDFQNTFIDGTSLRHADGRAFWVKLRNLRHLVYACWEDWSECIYPELKPELSVPLLQALKEFIPTVPCVNCVKFLHSDHMQKLPWCATNWLQLEIATRHLALHIDFLFQEYIETPNAEEASFDKRIKLIKGMNTLGDYTIQLFWILCALL